MAHHEVDSQQPDSPRNIPLVLIGVTRHTALASANALQALNRPNYQVVACLDSTESPKAFQFSPHNLGVVLHTLYPRPQGLVTGTAVTDDVLGDIAEVWDAYVRDVVESEGLNGACWVKVRSIFEVSGYVC
jgi:hypothetical protein